jgi:hypothetical protein
MYELFMISVAQKIVAQEPRYELPGEEFVRRGGNQNIRSIWNG